MSSLNASIPSTSCTQNLLLDASYEDTNTATFLADWAPHDSAGAVVASNVTGSTTAREGAAYMRASTAVSGGSIWQDLSYPTASGDNYEATVWVKADAALATPVTGTVMLSAMGGPATESDATPFTVGTSWMMVSAPLYVANSGHNQLALTLVMNTPGVQYDWDAASLVTAGMVNPSLEQGTNAPGWFSSGGGATVQSYADPSAMDGTWMGETSIQVANNGLVQNIAIAPQPGQSYEASVWVRSKGAPVTGYLALWPAGGTLETGSTWFTTTSNWQLVQAPLNVLNGGHTSLQVQLILQTTNTNLDFDGMALVNPCLVDASLEHADWSHWQVLYAPPPTVVQYAFYGGGGEDGTGWMQANTSNGTGGLGQVWAVQPPQGLNLQGGIWVRSHAGTAFNGTLNACVDAPPNPQMTQCGAANFTVYGAWTWVTAPLIVQLAGETQLRLQVYLGSGGNLDLDGASWAPANYSNPLPGAPTNVSASSAGNTGTATVSWAGPTAPVGNTVSSYTVTAFAGASAVASQNTGMITSATFTGLSAKGPYVFAAVANGVYGSGPPGASNNVTTTAVPGSISGLSAAQFPGYVNLAWTAPSAPNGSPISGYAVTPYLSGTRLETMHVGTGTSFRVPNLANGHGYTFSVAATNGAGTGPPVTSGAVTPGLPGAPSGVSAVPGNGQASVSWVAPAAPGATSLTGYTVTPYIGSTPQTSTLSWGSGTSAVVTGLSNGTAYTFSVVATNAYASGPSATSGSIVPTAVAPSAPQGVSATAGNAQASVTWLAPVSNGGTAITSYTVTPYIGSTAQTPTVAASSPATISGLTNGTAYTFAVTASNAIGMGPSASSLVVLPGSPPVLAAVTVSDDRGAGSTYPVGGVITYTATVSTNSTTAQTVTYSDTLAPTLSGLGAQVQINGGACGGGATCTSAAGTVSVSNLVVPGGGQAVITYKVVVTGASRGCASANDTGTVTIQNGNSAAGSVTAVVCDAGLGLAPWWSFATQAVASGGAASINPADGNLSVTQSDAMAMQLHQGLAFDLRRTYNSQETGLSTGLNAGVVEPFGAGWIPSFVDVGTATNGIQLLTPSFQAYANATPITMIEGSGTRDVFTPRTLTNVVDVDGLSSSGVLSTLRPVNLARGAGFNRTCVDESLTAPAGVHVSMWRYVETSAAGCTTLASSTTQVLGYAAIGTDRVRREFAASGRLLSIRDATANEVDYAYNGGGQLTDVTEASTGRKFHLAYPSGSETDVTDPGGELTKYTITAGQLTGVLNPDGSTVGYAYATTCGGSVTMLCSATDARGNVTTFSYAAAAVGRPVVAGFHDRNGNSTSITYTNGADPVIVKRSDPGNQQLQEEQRYASIDSAGRVGEVDAGSQANGGTWLHQTFYGWDSGAGCRQPDQGADNNLCGIVRRGLGGPDRVTYYSYNDEGSILIQRQLDAPVDSVTTSGDQALYFESTAAIAAYTDSLTGAATVTSQTQAGGRRDGNTLFVVVTQTQSLNPNGNAAGSGWSNYLISYKVDNATTVSTNTVNGTSSLCGNPAAPSANTGLVCEADQPKYDGVHVTTTNYTYSSSGDRITVTTPKANAEGLSGKYTFTYYGATDKDFAGVTVASGWLKGITDPLGNFVAFAYDAEGHQVRSWDRNATAGQALTSYPGTPSTAPSSAYTEALYTAGADGSTTTYASPGRYLRASRDATGRSWTTFVVDTDGNVTGVRAPAGTNASSTSLPVCPQPATTQTFDTCMTFDKDNNRISQLRPMEANTANYGAQKANTFTYDAFDNQLAAIDPNGHVTVGLHDALNRQVGTLTARGVTTPTTAPDYVASAPGADCFAKGSNGSVYDAPMPPNSMECWTQVAYDGVDNAISSTDANGAATLALFDADHRQTQVVTPRNDGSYADLVTVTLYDASGNPTDVCSPRELSEGIADSFTCSGTATFATHRAFDVLNRQTSATTYRSPGTASTITTAYDADGNPRTVIDANGAVTTDSFDVLDRRTSAVIPRSPGVSYTTTWAHDAAGNTTSQQVPIDGTKFRITDYSFDQDNRPIDTVHGASNASIGSTTTYNASNGTDVRSRNAYDADGNIVQVFGPNAFAASVSSPNPLYMLATSFNADDETVATYRARYDTTALTDPISAGQSTTQESQCPAGLTGLGYAATTGVCTTSYQYDPGGHRTKTVWPTATATDPNPFSSFSYFDDNLLASTARPSPAANGQRVTSASYIYDGQGRQTQTTDANGIYTQTTYTADGKVSRQSPTPNGSQGHATTYVYDAGGERTATTDALGNVATASYYPDGLTQSSTDGAGDVTSYAYDRVGNATQVMSPSANARDATNPTATPTTNTFTQDNLLASTLTPITGKTSRLRCYYYDQSGLKSNLTYSTSLTSCPSSPAVGGYGYSYGSDGRLAQETGTDGASTLRYQYDAAGNQTSAIDSTSNLTVAPTYYADDLVRTVAQGNGRTSNFAYDGAGNQTGDTSTPASGTTYGSTATYGDAGQMTADAGYTGLSGLGTTSWTYDAGGRVTQQNNANGSYERKGYNADGTLSGSTLWAGGSSVSSFVSILDGDYRVVQSGCNTCIGPAGLIGYIWNYQYDAAGRLSMMQSLGTTAAQYDLYDHDGNRLSHQDPQTSNASYSTYNADDSIAAATAGATTYNSAYSASGVLLTDGCRALSQDPFDRTRQVTAQSGAPSGCGVAPATTTYLYDARNRQTSTSGGGISTTLTYDGLGQTPAVETPSTAETAYLLTPAGTPLSLIKNSTPEYLSSDTGGSVATSTTATQAVQCQIQYDPYGTLIATQPSTSVCEAGTTSDDLLYHAGRRDPTTGSYQLGDRSYDPAKNSFAQPDHFQEGQPGQDLAVSTDPLTRNSYGYVNGDPVNLMDPSGHDPCGDCNGQVPSQGDETGGGGGSCAQLCTNPGTHNNPHGYSPNTGHNGRSSGCGSGGCPLPPHLDALTPNFTLPPGLVVPANPQIEEYDLLQILQGVKPPPGAIVGVGLSDTAAIDPYLLAIFMALGDPNAQSLSINASPGSPVIVLGQQQAIRQLTRFVRHGRNMFDLGWDAASWQDYTASLMNYLANQNVAFVVNVRGVGSTGDTSDRIGAGASRGQIRAILATAAQNSSGITGFPSSRSTATVTGYELSLLRDASIKDRVTFVNWAPGEGLPAPLPYYPLPTPVRPGWQNENSVDNGSPGAG